MWVNFDRGAHARLGEKFTVSDELAKRIEMWPVQFETVPRYLSNAISACVSISFGNTSAGVRVLKFQNFD
jgi:hypothetical protein